VHSCAFPDFLGPFEPSHATAVDTFTTFLWDMPPRGAFPTPAATYRGGRALASCGRTISGRLARRRGVAQLALAGERSLCDNALFSPYYTSGGGGDENISSRQGRHQHGGKPAVSR